MSSIFYEEDYKVVASQEKEDADVKGSGGGGSSCFPAGTFIRTLHGTKRIELVKQGDTLLAYDRFGHIVPAVVSKSIIHEGNTYTDSLYFLYSKGVCLFPNGVTGNHALYDITTNEHKKVSEFKIGDILTGLDDTQYPLTVIDINSNPTIPVYNILVNPAHTFFAGTKDTWIRVHNGGGGKASSQPRAASEAANTLQSSAISKVLEIISHGEIVGVLGGKQGVFFNNTVLENADASGNFEGITFAERKGTPSQTYIEGFTEIEAEVSIPGTVITSSGVVQQLISSNVNAARVTIRLPEGLWFQDSTNGDRLGYNISYKIETKDRNASTWNTVITKNIRDKTTSPWEIAHRVQAPTGSTQWDIRVVRLSAEDVGSAEKSIITFTRLTELFEETLTYDNIAYVGITVPAVATGNSIPNRAYEVVGIKVQVPTNYDTLQRTYGINYWDGSFKTDWTDNTAWILLDLIMNEEYGLNQFLSQPVDVDIYAFYEASLYNDCATYTGSGYSYALLDDGEGGTEVRFTFNVVIRTQQDAWQLLHAVASNMRANLVMKGNQISIIQDRPKLPVKLINNSSVIDGLFVYAGTEVSSRATAVNCTFNDRNDRYLPRVITEEDSIAINKYGYTVRDAVAYGVTKESIARRVAKWILDTEINQFDQLSFSLALNIVDLAVGEVISIMDDDYVSSVSEYLTGRVESIIGTTVTLGNAVTLDAGHTYTFGVESIEYTSIAESTITTGPGVTNTLTLATALPVGDYTNHEFMCYATGYVEPREFLITSITESSKGIYSIACMFYDKDKFARIEQGLVVVPPRYSTVLSTVLPEVTNIAFSEVFMNSGIATDNYIEVTWDWNTDNAIKDQVTYTLRWRRDNNNYIFAYDIVPKNFRIPSIIPGVYDVIIEVTNIQGKKSLSTYSSYNYRINVADSTLLPPENFYVLNTASTNFVDNHIPLTWTFPIANESKTDTLLGYVLESWTTDGATKLSTFIIKPNAARGGSFDYTLDHNINDFGSITPSREVQFKLYSRDGVGDVSIPIIANFNNAVPAAPSFTIISGVDAAYVNITPVDESDIAGFIVYRSITQGFTPTVNDIEYDGANTYVALKGDADTTYYYRVGVYDTFGKTGLNLASEQSSTIISSTIPIWIFTGLIFKQNDPIVNDVSWTAGEASVDGGTPITISAGNASWSSGILYLYYSGSGSVLSTTTDLAIAVQGAMVLATYKGGVNLIVGNGDAFTDGGLILANTVGANQLVVDSAIITNTVQMGSAVVHEAAIENLAVGNQKIKDFIESTSYNPATTSGWRIDKAGNITSYGSLTLMDGNGNVILTTGANAAIEWAKVINQTGFASIASLTQANISTYIANGAIQNAQIGVAAIQNAQIDLAAIKSANIGIAEVKNANIANLAVTAGKITDLSVGTLKIQDNAVTIHQSVVIGARTLTSKQESIGSLVITNSSSISVKYLITSGLASFATATSFGGGFPVGSRLAVNGSFVGNFLAGYMTLANGSRAGFAGNATEILLAPGASSTINLYSVSVTGNLSNFWLYGGYIDAIGTKK